MSKTRLLLGASLIALAIGSISTVQAGFDRAQDYTANLGSNANAGAYYNPYLSGQNQGAPQQQTHANAQPNGYSLLSPFGFNIGPVGASSPWGGFSFGGFGPGSQPTGFNIGPVGASSPWGGFYLGGMEPALSHPGGFNIGPVGASSPWGGFGIPNFGGGPGSQPGGFNIGPVGASSPWGGFNLGRFDPGSHLGGFNIGPVGASSPWGGFNLGRFDPGSHLGGFNIGPVGASSPWGGFNIGPVGASSPWGGFGILPFPVPFPVPGGGFNLGQMPQGGYAPQPSGTGGMGHQAQPVSCSINEVSALTRSVSDCEKAGGQTVAANTH